MDSTPNVVVVGGGIGGLATGIALSREGLQVRLLEQAPEFGEVGAGIQLAPNCTRILDDFGLLDRAKELGVLPSRMIMRDAVDGTELTHLDLGELERTYGYPYLVIHRSDLHRLLHDECGRLGVDLQTDRRAVDYSAGISSASVTLADGSTESADVVIAADGLHSVARRLLVDDEPVNSAYVAYRGAIPMAEIDAPVDLSEVVVYVGPGCHFVHYGLRGGEIFNQVAVFESAKALAGEEGWGTPDELDGAFEATCDFVQSRIGSMWRDRWWRMYDREPIDTWVTGRVALLGDAAHPPLQYMAQGAIMAIEDAWVLGQHVRRLRTAGGDGHVDWDAALAAYQAVRPEHCRRVVLAARDWGKLWHLDGLPRRQRNAYLRARDAGDRTYTDWIYGPTALTPNQEPEPYPTFSLSGVPA